MTQKPTPITIRPRTDVPPRHFVRAVFAQAQAIGSGKGLDAFMKDDPVTPLILARALQTPGSTTAVGWAAELAQDAFRNFLIDLAPYSGAARLIEQAVKAAKPSNVEFATNYPVRTSGPRVPAWVAENAPIPVVSGTFANVEIGPTRKQAHIIVWSRELSKRSDADTIMEQMLREDVAAGLDASFFATTGGSTAAMAGLLNGVTPAAGYGGGDKEAIQADLTGLSDVVTAGGSGNVTFIMNPIRVARLRIKAPLLFANLDIASSAAVPVDRVIAADGAGLLVAIDDAPDILVAQNPVIHMSDTPLEIVSHTGPTTADPVRSLWQTASLAIRVIHDLAFAKRRATAVAYLDGATW